MKPKQKPSACPCCGKTELYTGYNDSDNVCVACKCGLKMVINTDETWERACELTTRDKNFPSFVLQKAAYLALELAVERWNRRILQ